MTDHPILFNGEMSDEQLDKEADMTADINLDEIEAMCEAGRDDAYADGVSDCKSSMLVDIDELQRKNGELATERDALAIDIHHLVARVRELEEDVEELEELLPAASEAYISSVEKLQTARDRIAELESLLASVLADSAISGGAIHHELIDEIVEAL